VKNMWVKAIPSACSGQKDIRVDISG